MRRKNKIDARDLVKKIQDLTESRMSKEKVVSLKELRQLKESPYSVLVIEDDETLRLGMRRILEAEGYRVITAADGTQLASVIDDSQVDLIILDIGLPWINGFELAELMKAHEDLKAIPLIFVSGRTSELDIKRAFAVGADDYIKKPFEIEHLKKAVQTLLAMAYSG